MTVATGICLGEGTSTSGWGWLELASPANRTGILLLATKK